VISEERAVHRDLPFDRPEVAVEQRELLGQRVPVRLEHLDPLRDRVLPGPGQLDEALHVPDGHAGLPQQGEELDRAEVVRAVAAMPAARPSDRLQQSDPLVVAQRVRADAAALRGFFDGVRRLHIGHAKN
jgi:hypothetical protein